MKDIGYLVFSSTIGLFLVASIYYFISAAKVFLLVWIQPRLFRPDFFLDLSVKNLWKEYCNTFFKDTSLHYSTSGYLRNKGGGKAWQLLENKRINQLHNFLDAITSLLKPFVIIGVFWAVLKYMMLHHIAYNDLQITLAEIQPRIAYLKSLTWVNIIDTYKAWFFLTIILVCAFLGLTKRFSKSLIKTRKFVSTTFTVLSILGGLTFFGINLGATPDNQERKLKDLDFKIQEIHENIFKNAMQAVILQDISEVAKDDLSNREKESKRMDSFYQVAYKQVADPTIQFDLIAPALKINAIGIYLAFFQPDAVCVYPEALLARIESNWLTLVFCNSAFPIRC